MKKVLVVGLILILLMVGCGTKYKSDISAPDWYLSPPEDPNFMYGTSAATSVDFQIALDKAKQDARLDVAEQIESHIQGLVKKFDEEVGRTDDVELLQQYTRVSKNVVDQTLIGSRAKKSVVKKEGKMYRAFVLMEVPLGKAREELLNQLMMGSNEHMYTRFRASQSFKELEEEIQELREFKKEQMGY
ncbi:LPP20 family lipoprotein [candidate division WOR-3 bacterium]|nr:LPP20 family lipoprotein [candidate division WOR-3 bacterium]